MNILFVSNDSREATILTFELTKKIPSARLHTVYDTRLAQKELRVKDFFDAVIIDSTISSDDCSALTKAAKHGEKSIRFIALLEQDIDGIPELMQNIGIDNFIRKQPGYGAILAESILQPQAASTSLPDSVVKFTKKIRVLYVGDDTGDLSRYFSASPHIGITKVLTTLNGTLKLPKQEDLSNNDVIRDIIVIDSEAMGSQTVSILKNAASKSSEIPTIVLISAEDEDAFIKVMSAGASACIEKSGNYVQKLIPVLEKEILLHELLRENENHKTRGTRLRQIVESLPVGIAQIAPNGNVLAINQAGLRIFGINNLNQITGKNLLQLLHADEREKVSSFLLTVAGWKNAAIRIPWKGPTGFTANLELCGTPLQRDPGGAACILATIQIASGKAATPNTDEDLQQRYDSLTQSIESYESQIKELQDCFTASEERYRLLETLMRDKENAGQSEKAELKTFETARRDLEVRLQASEERCRMLETTLNDRDNARQSGPAELKALEAVRRDLEIKLQASEEHCLMLETTLNDRDNARQSGAAELKTLEAARRDLEIKLQTAEERCRQMETTLNDRGKSDTAELKALEIARRDLETKLQAAEEHCQHLETTLKDKNDARQSDPAELKALEAARRDLETKLQAAEEHCHELETTLKDKEDAHMSEKSEWAELEAVHQDVEAKLRASEERYYLLETKLQHKENARLSEKAERKELEATCQDLEARLQASEERCYLLETTLQHKENTNLSEKAERVDLEAARQNLEAKLKVSEERCHQLETTLKDKENTSLSEKAELVNIEAVRQSLEAKLKASEERCSQLETTLKDKELTRLSEVERAELEIMLQKLGRFLVGTDRDPA